MAEIVSINATVSAVLAGSIVSANETISIKGCPNKYTHSEQIRTSRFWGAPNKTEQNRTNRRCLTKSMVSLAFSRFSEQIRTNPNSHRNIPSEQTNNFRRCLRQRGCSVRCSDCLTCLEIHPETKRKRSLCRTQRHFEN
jgi:hypothetical protein